jgi:AraC-like DNA-binding protein
MSNQNCLALRLVRLKPAEEWLNKCAGLSFVCPQAGGGRFQSRTVTRDLAGGDVLVLNGAAGGKISVSGGGEFAFWYFTANIEHLFPLFTSDEITRLRNVTDDFNKSKLYPASSALSKQCHRLLADAPPQFDLDHRSQMLRVIAAILTVEFKNTHIQRSGVVRMEVHMMQVFERLTSEEILNLSVGELAQKFSCSRRHLNRLFHQHFGFSVASLRMEMRLLKAVSLLRDPETKIINVAEGAGFNHLGLFNTCFKRRFGKSPGEWRKSGAGVEMPHQGVMGVANQLRKKANCSANGTMADAPSAPTAEGGTSEPALTVVVQTRVHSESNKARTQGSPKARESSREPQAA